MCSLILTCIFHSTFYKLKTKSALRRENRVGNHLFLIRVVTKLPRGIPIKNDRSARGITQHLGLKKFQ